MKQEGGKREEGRSGREAGRGRREDDLSMYTFQNGMARHPNRYR